MMTMAEDVGRKKAEAKKSLDSVRQHEEERVISLAVRVLYRLYGILSRWGRANHRVTGLRIKNVRGEPPKVLFLIFVLLVDTKYTSYRIHHLKVIFIPQNGVQRTPEIFSVGSI
jgi:hypothetical protein